MLDLEKLTELVLVRSQFNEMFACFSFRVTKNNHDSAKET